MKTSVGQTSLLMKPAIFIIPQLCMQLVTPQRKERRVYKALFPVYVTPSKPKKCY